MQGLSLISPIPWSRSRNEDFSPSPVPRAPLAPPARGAFYLPAGFSHPVGERCAGSWGACRVPRRVAARSPLGRRGIRQALRTPSPADIRQEAFRFFFEQRPCVRAGPVPSQPSRSRAATCGGTGPALSRQGGRTRRWIGGLGVLRFGEEPRKSPSLRCDLPRARALPAPRDRRRRRGCGPRVRRGRKDPPAGLPSATAPRATSGARPPARSGTGIP